jgi:hypothetical protein
MNVMSKQKSSQVGAALSPVHPGLSTGGIFQLIERARAVYDDLNERHAKIPKNAYVEIRHNLEHQQLVWDYQAALGNAAAFLKPLDMTDVLSMLKLMDERLDDLVVNDHTDNGIDIVAELSALRRMLRGCLPVVAAELGTELDGSLQRLCEGEFVEVPR